MTDAFEIPNLPFGPNLKPYRELVSNASKKKAPEEFCQFLFDGIRRHFRQNIEQLTKRSTRLGQTKLPIANQIASLLDAHTTRTPSIKLAVRDPLFGSLI